MTISGLPTDSVSVNLASLKEVIDDVQGFFTSTEIDDSGTLSVLNCYRGSTLQLKIEPVTNAGYQSLTIYIYSSETTICTTQGTSTSMGYMIPNVCVTDSAIILFLADTSYTRPLIIAKNGDGDITVAALVSSVRRIVSITDSSLWVLCSTIGGSTSMFPVSIGTDEVSGIVYGNSVYNISGIVGGVYFAPMSCYRSQSVPFRFTFGGTNYVGLAGNSFFIKSD